MYILFGLPNTSLYQLKLVCFLAWILDSGQRMREAIQIDKRNQPVSQTDKSVCFCPFFGDYSGLHARFSDRSPFTVSHVSELHGYAF
jgi:hypothetical protein